ncbi:peptide chain release factor N(5)-glutamine methyltransferase [Candidatus Omnitrophota bacterium]
MNNRLGLLKAGYNFLSQSGIANAQGESELFLAHVLGCARIELYLDNVQVYAPKLRRFWGLLSERADGLPLQYLLGTTEFMGLPFKVRPGVFIPRPETEVLVETVLRLKDSFSKILDTGLAPKILDLGCGSGNIAISCAKYLSNAKIFACDISDSALKLSQENALLNRVNISLVKSYLFNAFKKDRQFSLIVSNPPYIKTAQISQLPRELNYEPKLAIDGGPDGLDYYRMIIAQASEYLQTQGVLVCEIGEEQKQPIIEILTKHPGLMFSSITQDYNQKYRVLIAQKKQELWTN